LLAAGVRELAVRELLAVLNALPLSDAQQREAVLEALLVTQAYREAVARARTWVELPAHTREQALYPLAYWDAVRTAAEESQVDPLLLLAVMRQESLFEPQAESPAGARGLMQLLPGTAQRAAAALGVEAVKEKLDDPVVNVRLGARYLRELLDRYQSDLTKALAAYNGGEMAADRWVTQAAGCDPDEFVERITYRETREYVKRVLSHYAAYARLYSSSSLAMSRSPRLP
jgi:soluble lytic murein transglycosylase